MPLKRRLSRDSRVPDESTQSSTSSGSRESDEDCRGNLRDFVVPDSQSIVMIDSSEDDRVPATPSCAQPTPSLNTVYHRVVEESHSKRKAEKQGVQGLPLSVNGNGSLSPLVEACERERHRQSLLDTTPSRQDCDLCAFRGFLPKLQRILEDVKDYVVRAEAGFAVAEELLNKCDGKCTCAPCGVTQGSAKRRVLGSPFQPEQGRRSMLGARAVLESSDSSDTDENVPLRSRRRNRL
ncbi:hypothetical protein HIM_07528 [Hirsutella minnesotensis 3608]|uniref:Uncharacterized protein n=1 Tax=Hirsutella minnesotensis 3608 TaxID=1043627 RepID=A0A0F8A486_9HYPO|nr:hypothetical protein HIM_11997 [Hirsutella minnesotensis 3608]KJZ73144.1 hypothetical protein HIM_07528 [Hirsutella minnesotensis 3608]